MLASRFLIYNKKRTLNTILSIILMTTLLLTISLIFSSVHKYLVQMSLNEKNYHVAIKSNDFKKPSYVKTKTNQSKTIYLKYKNIYKIKTYTKRICQKVKCQNIAYNEKLLSLYGLSKNNKLNTIKKILLIILFVLGLSSFFIIKNIFNLTLIERKKELGILKSVGLTKFQIIKNLIKEESINFIIGIIIGVSFSLWISELLLFIINNLLKDIFITKIILTFNLSFILIALIFITVVFYLSIIIPTFKICKNTIINLLKENTSFKNKKISKLVYYLPPLKRLAFSNYYRLKKNYRPIKLCVLITSILYIAFSLYLNYGVKSLNKYITIPEYDFFLVTKGSKENYKKLKTFSQKFQKHKIYHTCKIQGTIDETSYLNKHYNQTNIVVIKNKNEGIINYIKTNGKTVKYLKNNVILNINIPVHLKPINKKSFGLDELLTKENIIFLTNSFHKYCSNYSLNLYVKDKKNILKDLPKLKIKDQIAYTDVKKAKKLTQNFVIALKLALYGILVLIIIISISLIMSSFNLTVYQRKKELALLKSLGMTSFNIKKILFIEALVVLTKTFIFIIPISCSISYILWKSLNETVVVPLIIPKKEIFYSCIVTSILIFYSLISAYNKINKNTIIEVIRENNI